MEERLTALLDVLAVLVRTWLVIFKAMDMEVVLLGLIQLSLTAVRAGPISSSYLATPSGYHTTLFLVLGILGAVIMLLCSNEAVGAGGMVHSDIIISW